MKNISFIFILMLFSCTSSQSDKNKNSSVSPKNEMVCEKTATTGSHLKKKRCISKKLAKEIQEINKENMRQLNRAQSTFEKNKK